MNKQEFINDLKSRLRRLPADDVDSAINYYEEYFDDAGAENEQDTIKALGSPAAVASKIIGEYAINEVKEPKESKKSNLTPLWIAILAICASPIALPIIIAVIAVVFSVFVTVLALSFSGVAVAVSGVAIMIVSIWAFSYGLANGLLYLGAGMVALAVGLAMAVLTFGLAKLIFKGLQSWLGSLLIRMGTK